MTQERWTQCSSSQRVHQHGFTLVQFEFFWQLSPFCNLFPCSVLVNVSCFKWKFRKKQPQCASYAHTHTHNQGRWFFLGVCICSVLKSGPPWFVLNGFIKTAGKGSLRMELFANFFFLSSCRNVAALFRQLVSWLLKLNSETSSQNAAVLCALCIGSKIMHRFQELDL